MDLNEAREVILGTARYPITAADMEEAGRLVLARLDEAEAGEVQRETRSRSGDRPGEVVIERRKVRITEIERWTTIDEEA